MIKMKGVPVRRHSTTVAATVHVRAQVAKRRDKRPAGRTLAELGRLTKAERDLLKKCAAGKLCSRGVNRPAKPDDNNRIRADLIRFLAFGGDESNPVHEHGVWLEGAYVDGELDLEGIAKPIFVTLVKCLLPDLVFASDSRLSGLTLDGSLLKSGLVADRLALNGNLFLRDGFEAEAEVRVVGAVIGGDLNCQHSRFCAEPSRSRGVAGRPTQSEQLPVAFRAEGIAVHGDVFLDEGFVAEGEVRLSRAKITGNLSCSTGKFTVQIGNAERDDTAEVPAAINADRILVTSNIYFNSDFSATGEIRLTDAQIDGSLHCSGSFKAVSSLGQLKQIISICANLIALHATRDQHPGQTDQIAKLHKKIEEIERQKMSFNAQRMIVRGKLEMRGAEFEGQVDLTASYVGYLVDDCEHWPAHSLFLDGFCYDRISGGVSSAEARIRWLKKQTPRDLGAEFKPQPWEQLIKVLREMGHTEEATDIAISKRKLWGRSGELKGLRWLAHFLYGVFAVYGYRPTRTMLWVVGVMVYFAGFYQVAQGLFGPVAPAVQLSSALEICGGPAEPRTVRWTSSDCPLPPEYTTFQPLIYSADLILPFVDLQQEKDWAPILHSEPSRWNLAGHFLRVMMWFEIIFGWLMSLLLLAALGRVLNKD